MNIIMSLISPLLIIVATTTIYGYPLMKKRILPKLKLKVISIKGEVIYL